MTLIVDMSALKEPCPQCGIVWIQHPVDDKGERYCRDVTESIRHLCPESETICPYRLYENWMRVMENPEEAVP